MASHNFLELLVDAAVDVPNKPGSFSIDSQALRTLLFELVRQQRQSGDGSNSTLKASNEKLIQEVSGLQYYVKQLEKKMDQTSSLFDDLNRLEDVVLEIQENERIISESTNMLIADVEAVQDQLEGMQQQGLVTSSDIKGLPPGMAASDLLQRIEALEMRSLPRRKQSKKSIATSSRKGQRVSFTKRRHSVVEEVRLNMTSLSEKLTDPVPVEPKPNKAKPFLDLKESIQPLGMTRITAVEDFLSALKGNVSIQPKMLQELMIIFSNMEVDFFTLLVHAIGEYPSLTVTAFTEILDLLLTSGCNAQALVALYSLVADDPPKLPLEAFCAMLQCVKDAAKVTPLGLSELINILINCEGLIKFLNDMTELESWSWQSMIEIVEELHFSKDSTLLEMIMVMEKMSESELNELMSMLLTIPGYVNELMLSLPHTPSLSTQRLLEHLISLPGEAPRLLAQTVDLMVSSHRQKENILHMAHRFLELTSSLESDVRGIADCGFYQLLKMLYNSEHISLADIGEVLNLIHNSDSFTLEAVRALVQFSRDSTNEFVGALKALLMALMRCPAMKGELIQRTVRLLEKAKFISPRYIEELLVIMQQSGLLLQENFDPVIEMIRGSELNNAYDLSEFLSMVKHIDFLTLEDLGHVLEQNEAASKRAYEEALERQNHRIQEQKEAEEREAAKAAAAEVEEEEEDDEGKEAKEQDQGTLQRIISQSMSEPVTRAPSYHVPEEVQHKRQASLAECAQIHEMQKEIKELQTTLNSLLEVRAHKSGHDKDGKKRLPEKKKKKKPYERGMKKGSAALPAPIPKPASSGPDLDWSTDMLTSTQDTEHSSKHEFTSSSSTVSLQLLGEQSAQMVLESELREELVKLRNMVEQLCEHEEECKKRYQWLTDMVSVKAESGELARFQAAVKQQLHNFIHKTPPGPAGARQQLSVNCLSCDNKSMLSTKPPEQSLPMTGAFPPVLSQRPHRVYEMDLIRRHGRSLMEGNGDRVDLYSIPRACGGQHTSVDVRQTWTYEVHQKESCIRAADGRVYSNMSQTKTKSNGMKTSSMTYIPRPPNN